MRLLYINIVLALLMLVSVGGTVAQTSGSEEAKTRLDRIERLTQMGMENIRIFDDGDVSYVSFEDRVYRSPSQGIGAVIEALRSVDSTYTYRLMVVDEGVPQIEVTVPQNEGGRVSDVSYNTTDVAKALRGSRSYNRSAGRIDLVLYPELFLENSWYTKLYGVAVNISPAVEMSLWRGATAIGQVVIPLYTNMNDEKQYIRPGVIALRQSVRIYKQVYGELSIGNFQDDRIGVDLALNYHTADGRWGAGARGGLTGSSTFYGGEWVLSKWRRVTWDFWGSYYEPRYNLEVKFGAVRKIYGDMGVQGELSRRFGEVMIGFWGSYTASTPNGGFNFTVTLPWDRRPKRNKGVRVTYPEYYSFNYKARNGGNTELYGYTYSTRPDAGSLDSYFNPNYIMSELKKDK